MIELVITTPANTKTYSGLRSVTLPALSGVMEILSGHAESFILLKEGVIVMKDPGNHAETVPIGKSECRIFRDTVVVAQ